MRFFPLLLTVSLIGCVAPPAPTNQPDAPAPQTDPSGMVSPYDTAALDPDQRLQLGSQNYSFSPTTLVLQKGKRVILTIQNTGAHSFSVDELGIRKYLGPGENTVIFTPLEAGSFEYYCSLPGHRERGMFGTMIVQEKGGI